MVNGDSGTPKNAPAPWVPYTRAGCDWGATALANVVLENTGTGPAGDMTKVFGAGSPEWNEARPSNAAPAGTAARNLAQTDFVGLGDPLRAGRQSICARQPERASPTCCPTSRAATPASRGCSGRSTSTRRSARPTVDCTNATANGAADHGPIRRSTSRASRASTACSPSTTLSYVAQMQEAGIPVTFGYISDAHDQHGVAGEIHATRGPGEADYVQQLHRLRRRRSASSSTGWPPTGSPRRTRCSCSPSRRATTSPARIPTPAGCDGVTVAVQLQPDVGEINGNLQGLLATQQGITTPFTVHSDMAPTLYLNGNPARTAPTTRRSGGSRRAARRRTRTRASNENITAALADPVERRRCTWSPPTRSGRRP